MPNSHTTFLNEPRVEVLKSRQGRTEAVLVRLQASRVKAARSVQPNSEVLVDLNLDADDRPVSIVLHEPVTGPALVKTVDNLIHDAARSSAGGARQRDRRARSDNEVLALVLRGFFEGLRRLRSMPRPPGLSAASGSPA